MKKSALLLLSVTLLGVAGCKKSDPAPEAVASAAAPEPPPAVSIAPIPEPAAPAPAAAETAPSASASAPAEVASAAPTASDAPAATAPQPGAAASAAPAQPAAPKKAASIQACCSALEAAVKKGGKTKNQYTAAAAVCAGLEKQLKAGKAELAGAKATLRAQLTSVPVPSGC